MFDLSGQIAVVTGAFGRLGPVWIEALLSAGSAVAAIELPGVTPDSRWVAIERRFSNRVRVLRADVRDRTSLEVAAGQVEQEFGVPTILVNNAGIDQPPGRTQTHTVESFPVQEFRNVLEVNLIGAFQVTQVFGPSMVRARRGSIVNIGSLYGSVSPDARLYEHLSNDPPFLKPPGYGASKAGLINLTRYLAAHWGPFGIRVNALSPGGVTGDQDDVFKRKFAKRVPLGRMATPADLGGPLLFLASDASSYVTGIDLQVDGGFTVW
ncbi:MAG TPA: SDR family oxidoreductase [Gemmatimonadaceae bacterium]|nr:SDR family oxidoreductase [Gemmatimonadaceae bacterium]